MTDATAAQDGAASVALSRLADLGTMLRRSDIALAVGMMAILVVLILPLPPLLLDFALAVSITFSVLILMTSLFIHAPLEFSAFPTVLLIATMLRLALNLASTRLILARGHEGTDAAGHVIEAFGRFVMGGNFVIGIIVFTILVIVNFVVITKGSGRIAEVAARFHLDGMPGKQMAVDADLNAGLIDEKEARRRRKNLEDESGFFGAMDGASKFVRGDAIAGLLVVLINVIGGMVIGIVQQGLTFAEAAHTYTLLTVGDGLVTQVPALIVSTAAGLLVSKAGISGAADKALLGQLSGYPKALGMSAAVMLVMGLLPGIPMVPFLALGGGAAGLAYVIDRRNKQAAAEEAKKAEAGKPAAAEEPVSAALKLYDLKIELGYALLPLVNAPDGSDRLTEQIKALRRSLAAEMGFIMPAVRILDNVQLDANSYVIKIKEVESGTGKVWHGQYMVMDPAGGQVTRFPACTPASRPSASLPPGSTRRCARRLRSRATPSSMRRSCLPPISPSLSRPTCPSFSPTARCRSSSGSCRRNRGNSSRTSCRHRSQFPGSSACCRSFWPSACRSATCRPFSKASPTAWQQHATRRYWPSTCARGSRNSAPSTRAPAICRSSR